MLDFSTIRTVLFDMDGVIYRGKLRLPGVVEMIQFCTQHGITFAFVTNNAAPTPAQFQQKLHTMGIPVTAERIFSSAQMTARYLRRHYPRGTTAYVIGMEGLHEAMFADHYFVPQEQQPDLVVLGVDTRVTYEKFAIGSRAIQAGARYILTNRDLAFPSENGMMPGAGALGAVLHLATGVEPTVMGKPQPEMFRQVLDALRADPKTTLVVGDQLDTDIAGANALGIRSVLVLTGIARRSDVAPGTPQPDAIFEDLTELLDAWQQGK